MKPPRHSHARRRRKRGVRLPSRAVFYTAAGVAAAAIGLVMLGGARFLPFSAAASLLVLLVLVVDERVGFHTGHSGKDTIHFAHGQSLFLVLLFIVGVFVSVLVWATDEGIPVVE